MLRERGVLFKWWKQRLFDWVGRRQQRDSKNRMPSQWLNEMRKQTDPEDFKRIDLLSDAE